MCITIIIIIIIIIIILFAVVLHGSEPHQHFASKTAACPHGIFLPKGSNHDRWERWIMSLKQDHLQPQQLQKYSNQVFNGNWKLGSKNEELAKLLGRR